MKKLELTLLAAITAGMLTSSAFVASFPVNDETMLRPNSPVARGGGSLGYNISQGNVDRSN